MPGEPKEQQHAEQQPHIAHAGHDERLLRRAHRRRPLEPEADKQIRRQPHQFPRHEEEQQVIRDDKGEHRSTEERQIREEARVPLVAVHVADRVDLHEHGDYRDDDQHDRRELINYESHPDRQVGDHRPECASRERFELVPAKNLEYRPADDEHREHERRDNRADGDICPLAGPLPAGKQYQPECRQWEHRDQPC